MEAKLQWQEMWTLKVKVTIWNISVIMIIDWQSKHFTNCWVASKLLSRTLNEMQTFNASHIKQHCFHNLNKCVGMWLEGKRIPWFAEPTMRRSPQQLFRDSKQEPICWNQRTLGVAMHHYAIWIWWQDCFHFWIGLAFYCNAEWKIYHHVCPC